MPDGGKLGVEENTSVKQKTLGQDEVLSRIGVLSPQKLNTGECGLFLWLRREDTPLVYFQRSNTEVSNMVLDGALMSLKRVTRERMIGASFFERQMFTSDSMDVLLSIKAEQYQNIRQGLKIPQGTLSLREKNGWSASLPVAGMIGCQ